MTVRTYEELGREADLATRSHATAKRSVIEMGSPEAMAARMKIIIEGADWNNGLLHLVPFIHAEVGKRLAEIVPAAVEAMAAAAQGKVEDMRVAFEGRGAGALVPPPRVPRAEIDTLDPALLKRPPGEDHALDGSQSAKVDARPEAGTAAPSGPGGGETGEGAGQVPLGHSQAVPGQDAAPKPPAGPKLDKQQLETLGWIEDNPSKRLANTAAIGQMVAGGHIVRSGQGYTITDVGVAALAEANA